MYPAILIGLKLLNAFLKFNEEEILKDKGKISHSVAIALSEEKFEKFRVEQDRNYLSDFDKTIKQLSKRKKK